MATIILTGAAGNLGSKLRTHWVGRHRLCLIDSNPRGDAAIFAADLTEQNESWTSLFTGADAVVHLASNSHPVQTWAAIQQSIQLNFNVFDAARKANVPRVIFASSNHVMGGYKELAEPAKLTTQLTPRPGTVWRYNGETVSSHCYGLGKLCGEETGRCFAEAYGMTVIAVRIGWNQHGPNRPQDMPASADDWDRQMWLSDADACQLFDCCVAAQIQQRFLIVNGMSDNAGMRWDIEHTRQSIGYVPRDGIGRVQA